MRKTVLWVEDNARNMLNFLMSTVYRSGLYKLTLVDNVTMAMDYLIRSRYDVVILDMRLPPGDHRFWYHQYVSSNQDKGEAQLGLRLLHWMTGHKKMPQLSDPPGWLSLSQVGIFTVEEYVELERELPIGFRSGQYELKHAGMDQDSLLNLIQRVDTLVRGGVSP